MKFNNYTAFIEAEKRFFLKLINDSRDRNRLLSLFQFIVIDHYSTCILYVRP